MALRDKVKVSTYRSICNNVDVDKLKKNYPNIPDNDINMYMCTDLFDICESIRGNLIEKEVDCKGARNVEIQSLKCIKTILDSQKYYLRKQRSYNEKFIEKDYEYNRRENFFKNPFFITYNLFENQFVNLEQNSDLDISAKLVYWSNKVVKDVEIIKENVMNDIINKNGDRKELNKFERQTMFAFTSQNSTNSLKNEYLLVYKKFLANEITKEELEEDQAYIAMSNLLDSKKSNGLEISHEQAFNYLSVCNSIRSLYLLKDFYTEKIFSLYANQEKEGSLDKDVIIYKKENEQSNNLKQSTYNCILTILVKDTNAPISIHSSGTQIKDMEDCYSIELPTGNTKFDNINLLYMKYNDTQKQQIEVLNSSSVKSKLDSDVTSYIETQHNMCNDLDKIIMKSKEIVDRREELC